MTEHFSTASQRARLMDEERERDLASGKITGGDADSFQAFLHDLEVVAAQSAQKAAARGGAIFGALDLGGGRGAPTGEVQPEPAATPEAATDPAPAQPATAPSQGLSAAEVLAQATNRTPTTPQPAADQAPAEPGSRQAAFLARLKGEGTAPAPQPSQSEATASTAAAQAAKSKPVVDKASLLASLKRSQANAAAMRQAMAAVPTEETTEGQGATTAAATATAITAATTGDDFFPGLADLPATEEAAAQPATTTAGTAFAARLAAAQARQEAAGGLMPVEDDPAPQEARDDVGEEAVATANDEDAPPSEDDMIADLDAFLA